MGASEDPAVWIDDPSEDFPRSPEGEIDRWTRLIGDFNVDGVPDLALSLPHRLNGNAGGINTVYLGREDGKFRKIGQFFGWIHSLALEQVGPTVYFWTYSRAGGNIGYVGYHVLADNQWSEFHKLEIHPGDGGGTISNRVLHAVFEESDIPFTIESLLIKDGAPVWAEWEKSESGLRLAPPKPFAFPKNLPGPPNPWDRVD